jgi:integrase
MSPAEPTADTPESREPNPWELALDYYREHLGVKDATAEESRLGALLRILHQGNTGRTFRDNPLATRARVAKVLKQVGMIIGHDQERLHDLLLRIIDEGVQSFGWTLPDQIPDVVQLPREPPVLPSTEMARIPSAERLLQALSRQIADLARLPPEARLGQILLAAILEGGLLRRDLQTGFTRITRPDLGVTPSGSWLTISAIKGTRKTDPDGLETSSHVLWQVRPLTELLLLRLWAEDPDARFTVMNPWTALRHYFKAAGLSRDITPTSLGALNHWARALQAIQVPPLLRNTMTGRLVTIGVPAAAHRRIWTGCCTPAEDDSLDPRLPAYESCPPPPERSGAELGREIKLLKSMLGLMSQKSESHAVLRERIERTLRTRAADLSPVGWLVGQWLLQMLRATSRELRISSIKRYYGPVYRYVVPAFHGCDYPALTGDDWLMRMQAAVDSSNDSMAPLPILLFCEFTLAQPTTARFEPQELEGMERAARVSPNLISVADFENAAKRIRCETARETVMARLAAALGFYAGLRRGEATHILLDDLSGTHDLWLLVRSNRHYRVKRFASQRKLPLGVLLPTHWLQEIKRWREQRRSESRREGSDELLLCLPGGGSTPLKPSRVIDPIRDALRTVTQDRGLVFHHLRHSFANWTLLRLLAPEIGLDRLTGQMAALRDPWFDAAHCRALRAAVLSIGSDDLPARHAGYALSRLLGHTDVATTLHHYVHLADLLIYRYQTMDETLNCPRDSLRSLLGLMDPHAPFGNTYHRWYRLERKLRCPLGRGYLIEPTLDWARRDTLGFEVTRVDGTPPDSIAPTTDSAATTARATCIGDIPAVLGALFTRRLTIATTARNLGLSIESVAGIKDAAQELETLRTKGGRHPRFRIPPVSPRSLADGAHYKEILAYIERVGLDVRATTGAIDLLKRADPHRGRRVILGDPEEARAFALMLESLGIARRAVRVNLYVAPEGLENALRYWMGILDVPAEQFQFRSNKIPSVGMEFGQIALEATSQREMSRFRDLDQGPRRRDYDPIKARRALALIPDARLTDHWEWTFSDSEDAACLSRLLGWLGLPEISRGPSGGGFLVRMPRHRSDPMTPAQLKLGLTVLAGAYPYHNLRVVSQDMENVVAVIALLRAWGLGADRLHLEQVGGWPDQRPPYTTKALAKTTGIHPEHIATKPRKGRPWHLSLTVRVNRGRERIKSYGLTYALIILFIYVKGVLPHQEVPGPRLDHTPL